MQVLHLPTAKALTASARFLTRASLLSLALLSTGLAGVAHAGGGAATDAYEGVHEGVLDVHGLLELYAEGNFNSPASKANQLRAFDTQANQPSLGLLHLLVAHKPETFGFRLDVGAGDFANGYLRSDPAATAYPGLSRQLSYVEQAFVTAVVPVGRGLSIDVGKFGTPVGLEDNEAIDNWNYSRSLLYLVGEPGYHSGARVTYPLSDTLAVSAFWVNGWDTNVLAGNGMRTVAGAVSWRPSAKLEVVADYMAGPERALTRLASPALAFRHELDLYATYALTDHVTFAASPDYGHDAAKGGVSWWGIAGYLRVQGPRWLAATLRAEHYADSDGFTTGAKQNLAELTLTLEARFCLGPVTTIGRLEYRRDQSDARVFAASGARLVPRQDTLGLALIAAF